MIENVGLVGEPSRDFQLLLRGSYTYRVYIHRGYGKVPYRDYMGGPTRALDPGRSFALARNSDRSSHGILIKCLL